MSASPSMPLTWELDSLMPHPASDAFAEILANYESDLAALAEQSESLPAVGAAQAAEWAAFLKQFADLDARTADLNAFVHCHASADAENATFRKMEARLAALSPGRQRIATNVDFALQTATDDELSGLISADPWLSEIRFHLEERRTLARLRLPKEQERLASELDVDGLHAWGRLYDRLSGALRVSVMERGEIVEKSVSQVQLDSPERSVRENNFYASNNAWSGIAETCADALNHIAGVRLTRYRHLGLVDHLDVPLLYNRIERSTLETMWQTVTDRKPILTPYLEGKAKLLGVEKLAWFDQAAPLPLTGVAGSLDWDTACDTVIQTFDGFSGELGDFGRMTLRDRWIEAENRPGKRQGGFCTGFPTKKQSRIFMTFTDSPDSMSTLAHELGHAYHSWVLNDQPLPLQDYPMGLAETASTFAEAVLGDVRLERAESPPQKLMILDQMLSDAVSFMMNIHCRFLFEDAFHRERLNGEVSADRLSELMSEAQAEAYLGQLEDGADNPLFWVSKLHFYITGYPFYNFPYTFGYLLSLGMYALADQHGDAFPERYRDFLKATGCMNAEDAVQSTFGEDLRKPGFWNRSIDIIESRVGQFADLLTQI